jgi:hypothetical protein
MDKSKTKFDKLANALKNNILRRKIVEKNKNKDITVLSKQDSQKKSIE